MMPARCYRSTVRGRVPIVTASRWRSPTRSRWSRCAEPFATSWPLNRVDSKKKQHKLTKDQEDQLKERRRTEEAAAETAFRQLYSAVWLPRVAKGGSLDLEKIAVGGRPLQATGVHERVMELLTAVGTPKIHGTLHPRKIAERVK